MKDEISTTLLSVAASGQYILGKQVSEFETALAKICDVDYALTVANGTDALVLSMKALGIGQGDEVIVPTNSFIASAGAVVQTGATPVFCDVNNDYNMSTENAEKLITSKTKALMPVHLTGRPADMPSINQLAKKYDLYVIEDAAQAIGASLNGQKVGSMGDLAGFSLHPLKNLFVMGDGGFITMKCPHLYEKIKRMRNHGLADRDICVSWGINSRLDTIHCAVGLVKLKHFSRLTKRFKEIAKRYCEGLKDIVIVPIETEGMSAVYHNFVITCERREALMNFLKLHNIETKTHYPVLLHKQPASRNLNSTLEVFPVATKLNSMQLSLPIFPEIEDDEISYVIEKIRLFYQSPHF